VTLSSKNKETEWLELEINELSECTLDINIRLFWTGLKASEMTCCSSKCITNPLKCPDEVSLLKVCPFQLQNIIPLMTTWIQLLTAFY